MVYDYAVIHWGDWDYLNVQPKTFFGEWQTRAHYGLLLMGEIASVYLITTGTSAIIMQVYLMIRIFKLSRNWILVCPLAVMCVTSSLEGSKQP